MKKHSLITMMTLMSTFLLGLASCGDNGKNTPSAKFSFTIALESGRNGILYKGVEDKIAITTKNTEVGHTYNYTFTVVDDKDEYLTIDDQGKINPIKVTENDERVAIMVRETTMNVSRSLSFIITEESSPADAGYNWASNATVRQEVLGKLEKYSMDNFLTGITLFENGGYVRYSNRVKLKATEYITGYGFGLLTEGRLEGTLDGPNVEKPTYLQSASSSDPLSINAWDATGSQVSDLNSYISSSYWGTRMKGTNSYEWYPVLAKDKVNGQDFLRPIHVEPDNELNMYKTWKIYVKTGASDEEGIAYRTNSSNSAVKAYDKRPVALEDYEFVYQMLLSQESKVSRGSELAGDTSYGIKGGQKYFRRTKGIIDNEQLDKIWKEMQDSDELGIHTGKDAGGSYIILELVNPIDSFTAMYTLSSNLYTPIPKSFLQLIGGGDYTEGARLFGTFPDKKQLMDLTLCLGPYYLEEWQKNIVTCFKLNEDWYEVKDTTNGRYNIPGVRIRIITRATQVDYALYDEFEAHNLDSAGIPKSRMEDKSKGLKTRGDSTFKLNINSCDQDRWNEIFGANGYAGTSKKDNAYLVKPWMSNSNFLKGLYWSIDRKTFADARGVTPSINYFADSYLSDPENAVSYNQSKEHKDAIEEYHFTDSEGNDNYGYSPDLAKRFFAIAVQELANEGKEYDGKKFAIGTKANPFRISFNIEWMYQSDPTDYGDEIVKYIVDNFNDDAVCGGGVQLSITQHAVTQWDQVYNDYLMEGKYDLGFGAISGNSYNPLNFLEVLKSDNSSGFTLNWGADTSKVDPVNPIVYDGKTWSFDALWAAADHGAVVKEGRATDPIEHCYMSNVSDNNLYNGGSFNVGFKFTEVENKESVKLQFSKAQIYLLGQGSIMLTPTNLDTWETDGYFHFELTAAIGKEFNDYIVVGCKLDVKAEKATDPEEKFKLLHPFTYDQYDIYWNVEIYYTLTINDGYPTESVTYAYISKDSEEAAKRSFVRA